MSSARTVLKRWQLGAMAVGAALSACSGEATGTGTGTENVTSGLAFHAEAKPLADFSYDTGLIPASSPAQVQLKLSAGGGLTVDAAGAIEKGAFVGRKGGGKLALDLHLDLEGKLKVDSTFKKYEGELPGLKDVHVPIKGEVAFDPFLTGEGESAEAKAPIPETTLPPIPLGSVPGSLILTVASGSELTTKFHGTCVSVTAENAAFAGKAETSGLLVLKGTIKLELPAPLNKEIELPEIKVKVPALEAAIDGGSLAVKGAADSKAGAACGGAPAKDDQAAGGTTGGDTGGTTGAVPAGSVVTASVDGERATIVSASAKVDTVDDQVGYLLTIGLTTASEPRTATIQAFVTQKGSLCSGLAYQKPSGGIFYMGDPYGESPGCDLLISNLPTAKDAHLTGSFAGDVWRGTSPSNLTKVRLSVIFDIPVAK